MQQPTIKPDPPKVVREETYKQESKTINLKPITIPKAKERQNKPNSEYGQYNNTRKSWWYKKNVDAPPSVPQDVQQLMDQYGGIYLKNSTQKVLYLTFDEGYENGYTPKILDVLKENQVKAMFFITGPYLKNHSDLVERMIKEGHEIANHTINHPSMPEITDDNKLEEEIIGLERSFYEQFGKKMKYIRPPKGEYSERTLAMSKELGYKTVFWSFAYLDWDVKNQKGADHAFEQVMNGIHNGAVILLHAVSKDNAEALDRIIMASKEKGYEFKMLE